MVKQRVINSKHTLIISDNVAEWDGPDNWERERIDDMITTLCPEDLLFDIGTEFGWISALIADKANPRMLLVEPSREFWPNIYMTWRANNLTDPVACFVGFVDEETTCALDDVLTGRWPDDIHGPESGAMAYRYLHSEHHIAQSIPVITIDHLTIAVGPPTAVTIDIEGAETRALRGAEQTLREYRPVVWCSIHPDLMARDYDTCREDVLGFMEDAGYKSLLLAVDHEEHWRFDPR